MHVELFLLTKALRILKPFLAEGLFLSQRLEQFLQYNVRMRKRGEEKFEIDIFECIFNSINRYWMFCWE